MSEWLSNIDQLIVASPALAFAAVFLAGVLVSFTPCVYPVIPLTLGYIGARSAGSRWKGLSLSLVYVLGMAVTYAAMGAAAALTGKLFGNIGSSPWTYLAAGNICLLLALAMLDIVRIPQLSLAPARAAGPGRGGYLGVFVIGLFSGLIVGPCTAPVLASILVYVGSKQNVAYGVSLLFTFGYGVGFLLILLGTFAGLASSLPKAGPWLDKVKKGFGIALLFAAEYYFIKTGALFV